MEDLEAKEDAEGALRIGFCLPSPILTSAAPRPAQGGRGTCINRCAKSKMLTGSTSFPAAAHSGKKAPVRFLISNQTRVCWGMLALLGGDGERKHFHGRAGRFPEQWEGWNIKAGLQMRISYSGNVPLQPREYFARRGMDGSRTPMQIYRAKYLPGPSLSTSGT